MRIPYHDRPQPMTPAPNTIHIRPIQASDLRAYVPIRLEALRDHPTSFGSSYEDCRDLTDDAWLGRLASALDGAHARLFTADAGHELAGLLGVFRDPGTKVRHAATLYSVYVRPAYRGRHLVDRLLEPALAWSRDRGVTILRLTVTTTNAPAIRCYTRLGFQTTGTLPQYIRTPDGAYHDEYMMSRPV